MKALVFHGPRGRRKLRKTFRRPEITRPALNVEHRRPAKSEVTVAENRVLRYAKSGIYEQENIHPSGCSVHLKRVAHARGGQMPVVIFGGGFAAVQLAKTWRLKLRPWECEIMVFS